MRTAGRWVVVCVVVAGCSGAPDGPDAASGDAGGQAADAHGTDAATPPGDAGGQAADADGTDAARPPPCDDCWRSALYPDDWTPETTVDGRFLHDFSYAGYHHGERPLPDPADLGPIFDVTDHGASPDGEEDSTAPIQDAIDAAAAAGGGVVFLPSGLYRCDGVLRVTASGIVIRGAGPDATRLYFTDRDVSIAATGQHYDLLFRGEVDRDPEIRIAEDAEARSFDVLVGDALDLAPGELVAVDWTLTDAFVEERAMGGDALWGPLVGDVKTFFRRRVVAVDRAASPDRVTLDVPLRHDALVRDRAAIVRERGYLTECGVESLSISNAIDRDAAWIAPGVHAIGMDHVRDCFVRDVRSFASPAGEDGDHIRSGGIKIIASSSVTLASVELERAQNRGPGGSGYLFQISSSSEVLIRDSSGRAGRHNFITNPDFGTSGCVFLRVRSELGRGFASPDDADGYDSRSEYHRRLAMACLVDGSELADGWRAANRGDWSSGAGHTVTESVFWNVRGAGLIESFQLGDGYVIGTGPETELRTALGSRFAADSEPEDHVEGLGDGARLAPSSLYEDQLARRLAR